MARFLRFVSAILCFPLVCALGLTFVDSFFLVSDLGHGLFSAEAVSLVVGMVAFLAMRFVAPDPVRLYVLGHELTHAAWGLMFGAKVSDLKVGVKGGSVKLTKTNVWITLAPYFFPFWTIVVVLLALAVRAAMHFAAPGASFPAPWAWTFTVGFTWCFHLCFTIRSLMQTQPDVEEYGRVFSWTLIAACNLLGAIIWIACTTDVTFGSIGARLWVNVAAAYLLVYRCSRSVAALLFGRGVAV